MLKVRIHLTKLDLFKQMSLDFLRVRAETFILETQIWIFYDNRF